MIMNDYLKRIQKETGIKMGKYDNDKNMFYHMSQACLKHVDMLIKKAEELELVNDQTFLSFLDKLNEYSVKY